MRRNTKWRPCCSYSMLNCRTFNIQSRKRPCLAFANYVFVTECLSYDFVLALTILFTFLSRATRPISHCVCRLVGQAFTFSLRIAFTAPAQLNTVPAQPPATKAAVFGCTHIQNCLPLSCHKRTAQREEIHGANYFHQVEI